MQTILMNTRAEGRFEGAAAPHPLTIGTVVLVAEDRRPLRPREDVVTSLMVASKYDADLIFIADR